MIHILDKIVLDTELFSLLTQEKFNTITTNMTVLNDLALSVYGKDNVINRCTCLVSQLRNLSTHSVFFF